MSETELRDQVTELELAIIKLDRDLTKVAEAARELAYGSLALIERVKRIEDRLGMEA